ncbi:MAG TPA: alpha-amylase family glycosyl hydrolase [Herpetosiphonaceae bacterium]|nr:alpha-amylase family glycosyl hydrolase [Herpetosiphonaceae bacterium]
MMVKQRRIHRLLTSALPLLLILAACGADQQAAPEQTGGAPGAVQGTSAAQPATQTTPAETSAQATATAGETTVTQQTNVAAATATAAAQATAAETAAPTKNLPTAAPTITVGPTATAFPLAAGWWDDAVCYEIFVRSFFDSDGDGVGDLKGLTAKLDYLNDGDDAKQGDLGVNCLWLMPVAESPSYHGYDVVDYRKIETDYGTNDDWKTFIAAAHERGIKVIVDIVLNHTSREHPWFQEAARDPQSKYRDWYLWSKDDPGYKGPWQQGVWHKSRAGNEYFYGIFCDCMPDLNYRNPAVTEEAQAISRFWIEEMGVDGFRLDAIRHLMENGREQQDTPETHAWLREYRTFLHGLGREVFTVGEVLVPSTETIATYYPDQLDTFFEFAVAASIPKAINIGAAPAYVSSVSNAYTRLPFQRFAPLLTNHDQNRIMSQLQGNVDKAKLAATALLTAPGLPFLYYGEEVGMQGVKAPAPEHDETLRAPMQWTGERTGGFSTRTPWQPFGKGREEMNVAALEGDPNSLLNLYRRLIHLHRTHPALGHGSMTPLKAGNGAVAAFVRQAEDEAVLVLLNFGSAAKEGVTVSVEGSELAEGTYQLQPLLGDAAGAPLAVGPNGAIAEAVPLATLAPRTGYIFQLTK